MHLFLVHALVLGQSEFTKHSGRQLSYGFPKYPATQIHAPAPDCSLHSALDPHGDGLHGVNCSLITRAVTVHCTVASPVNPSGHKHVGVWLITRHSALEPHAWTQGFWHFLLIQAILGAHSLLLMHSGRQLGGDPRNSGIHWHAGVSCPLCWHMEFGPHGDGWQGFEEAGGVESAEIIMSVRYFHLQQSCYCMNEIK